ncbi:MAG: P-loop NTPase fold protein [Thermodesulfobacteriota bacterium]
MSVPSDEQLLQEITEKTDKQIWNRYQHEITEIQLKRFFERALRTRRITLPRLEELCTDQSDRTDTNDIRREVVARFKAQKVGLQDVPVEHGAADALDIRSYAAALAKFIIRCGTPTAIAIQGDWGSGKSTCMKFIREHLEGSEENPATCIEFNCWEHSQFHAADHIPVFLMAHFVKQVAAAYPSEAVNSAAGSPASGKHVQRQELFKRVLRFSWELAKAAGGELLKNTVGLDPFAAVKAAGAASSPSGSSDWLDTLKQVRDGLQEIVDDHIAAVHRDRVVVFIDDLDRLEPLRAIELLEALKTFLDVRGCVFVIACDYAVVKEGLRQKFPRGSLEQVGKSFLDKVFQLSVPMPTGMYNVGKYLEELLREADLNTDGYREEDLKGFKALLENSVGFNPRNVKRLVNNLALKNIIQDERLSIAAKGQAGRDAVRKQQIFFGAGCMEAAFNKAYQMMLSHAGSKTRLAELLKQDLADKNWILQQRLVTESAGPDATREFMEEQAERLVQFNETFFRILDANPDGDLDQNELKPLQEVLTMMRPVSTTDSDEVERVEQNKLFSEFLRSVLKELSGREDCPVPNKGDHAVMGGPTGKRQYLRVWFGDDESKNGWHSSSLFYRVCCDRTRPGKIVISMERNLVKLREKGVEPSDHVKHLKDWSKKAGYTLGEPRNEHGWFVMSREIGDLFIRDDLDSRTRFRKEVLPALSALFTETANLFDKRAPGKVNGKLVAEDIMAGMEAAELVKKHGLKSTAQLPGLVKKLVAMGFLTEDSRHRPDLKEPDLPR